MPKQIVISACFINNGGDAGSQPYEEQDYADVGADAAIALARAGRTLYVSKSDDPTKGAYTATPEQVKAADDKLAAAKAAKAAK